MKLLFEMDLKDYEGCTSTWERHSARSIIIRNGKVAMVHSLKYDYYKFPGGGIEGEEDHITTLIREVKEEAGLTVISSTIREYGMVRRIQKGKKAGTVFVQDNFYYFCEVHDGNTGQNLDDYESEEGFTLEYVFPEHAVSTNRYADHGEKNDDDMYALMIEREARVLEMIMSEL